MVSSFYLFDLSYLAIWRRPSSHPTERTKYSIQSSLHYDIVVHDEGYQAMWIEEEGSHPCVHGEGFGMAEENGFEEYSGWQLGENGKDNRYSQRKMQFFRISCGLKRTANAFHRNAQNPCTIEEGIIRERIILNDSNKREPKEQIRQ